MTYTPLPILFLGPTPALARAMTFKQLALGDVNRAANVSQIAAGKSINAARAAYTMGAAVACTGFTGGTRGQDLIHQLQSWAESSRFVTVEPETRLCVTLIDESSNTCTELVEESAPIPADRYDTLATMLTELLPQCSALVLSGSLTPGAPPDFYARCITLAQGMGVMTIVDAAGAPLQHAMKAKPTWIKPNSHELAAALGKTLKTQSDIAQACQPIVQQGTNCLISMGASGALLATPSGSWLARVPTVSPVVSPIGCGDTLAGVLAFSLTMKADVKTAVSTALGAACANVLTTLPAVFDYATARKYADQVTFSDLK